MGRRAEIHGDRLKRARALEQGILARLAQFLFSSFRWARWFRNVVTMLMRPPGLLQ